MRAMCSLAMLLTVLVVSLPWRGAAATLEPLVAGWESVFKLDWQLGERRGAPVVRGDVVNTSPYTVTAVQLLVEALDAGGAVVTQKVVWATPATMSPFMRTSFELPAPAPASPRYRVRIFAFDRVEVRGGMLSPRPCDAPSSATASACSSLPDGPRVSASLPERISTETEVISR